MKILFCAHDRPDYINGPNIWLRRLLAGLRPLNMEGIVLFFPSGDPARCESIQALKNDGFRVEVYSGRKYTEFRMRWILDMVIRYSPDIFVPNLDIPAYHLSSILRNASIPTVGVLHSDDSFYRAIVDEFIGKAGQSPLSAVVCVSRFLEDLCHETSPGNTKILRIPYGVPVPEKSAVHRDKPFRLVYAGRLVEPQKRISDVTRSLCRLVKEVPGTEAVLYGSGPSLKDVQEIIETSGCSESVRLGGLVNSGDLQKQYLDSQVFVLLSDYEGLPIALMEAMACGLVPVCHSMRSGIPELVTNGESGLIVADREDAFIDAVRSLATGKDLWEKLSSTAKARVETDYSIRSSTEKWASLFREIAAEQAGHNSSPELPGKLELPARHPGISEFQDKRWPGLMGYYRGRAGSALRRIVG